MTVKLSDYQLHTEGTMKERRARQTIPWITALPGSVPGIRFDFQEFPSVLTVDLDSRVSVFSITDRIFLSQMYRIEGCTPITVNSEKEREREFPRWFMIIRLTTVA